MCRLLTRLIIIFFFFISFQLKTSDAFSQALTTATLIDKFDQYSKQSLQEKIYVHTDKDFYVAGEIIWFKLYYIDGNTNKALQFSKVAYVEISNAEGKPELQAKIPLGPGQSKGSFYLPVSLNSGNYMIRAYTRWMKNFDPSYFFQKKITVVNTLKGSGVITAIDTARVRIDFFPEGGNLVSGFQSKVGFRATGWDGKGINCSGWIVNEVGDTVLRFSPSKFGTGNFLFQPIDGQQYRAEVLLPDGRTIPASLPAILSSGYVLKLVDNGDGYLKMTVYRKKIAGEQDDEQVLLAAHAKKRLSVAEVKLLRDGDSAVFSIDKKKIEAGLTHFTLFNGSGRPVAERLFYEKPTQAILFDAKTDREIYSTRQQVNLTLNKKEDDGKKI